jgi:hypothetical protein
VGGGVGINIRHSHERISRLRGVCFVKSRREAALVLGSRKKLQDCMQVVLDLVQVLDRPPVRGLVLVYLGDGALAVLSIASRSVACDLSVQLIVRQRILEHLRRLDEDDDYNREVQRQIEADWSSEHWSDPSWLEDSD